MKAFTDYPITLFGDIPGKEAPIRECRVLGYDGDKYCEVEVDGIRQHVKAGYIYQRAGRCGAVPVIDVSKI